MTDYHLVSGGNSHIEFFKEDSQKQFNCINSIEIDTPLICLRIKKNWMATFTQKDKSKSKKGCEFVNYINFYHLDEKLDLGIPIKSKNKIFCETNAHFDFQINSLGSKTESILLFAVNSLVQNFSLKNNPLVWDLKNVCMESILQPGTADENISEKFIETKSKSRITALSSAMSKQMFAVAFKSFALEIYQNTSANDFQFNWERTHVFNGMHEGIVTGLQFHDNDKCLYTGSLDKSLRVLNITKQCVEKIYFTSSPVLDFAIGVKSKNLFCVTWDPEKTFRFVKENDAIEGGEKKKNWRKEKNLLNLFEKSNEQNKEFVEILNVIHSKITNKNFRKKKKNKIKNMKMMLENNEELIDLLSSLNQSLKENLI